MNRLPNKKRIINKTCELLNNPYIGFTSFQHFRDEPLFSDCSTTEGWKKEHYPVYQWVEENGRSQGFYPDTEIAYVRVLWKYFEPRAGEYDYSFIEDIFEKAKRKKQSVMLRLMPHTTKRNEDVPDWLRAIIPCPDRPDTERVKDSPSDPLFLQKFALAVRALGEKFDGKDNFYAMDISLCGAWGEGHGLAMYPENEIRALIDVYTDSFKRTHLLGQICSPELIRYACKSRPIGFRADHLGNGHHMNISLPERISRIDDIWMSAPVSFECFWYFNEWKKQGWDVDSIIDKALGWHISSINGKSSPIPYEWRDKIDRLLKKMGYRFSVVAVEYPETASGGDIISVNLTIENSGVAPIYNPLPFTFRLKGADNMEEYIFDTDINARDWMPGETVEGPEIQLPNDIKSGAYNIEFRLGGEKYPTVKFAMDTKTSEDGYNYLATIIIE